MFVSEFVANGCFGEYHVCIDLLNDSIFLLLAHGLILIPVPNSCSVLKLELELELLIIDVIFVYI
jgi:hypothetical protein